MELQTQPTLTGYSEAEKAAYLGALAALASSDNEASTQELLHLREIAQSLDLSTEQEESIIESAKDSSGENLKKCLDILKTSELRYSLITDMMAVANADDTYSAEEKSNIEKVAQYLSISHNQFSVLDQFVSKTADADHTPEELSKPNFLQSLGMQDKFSNAGFNMGSIGKSIFGFLGPLLLSGLASRSLRGNRSNASRGLGGGLLSGLLSGGGLAGGMGGLGSLLSGINTSRNNGRTGGLLSRLFR